MQELLKLLKEKCGNKDLRLPRDISFSIDIEKVLNLKIQNKGLINNMQTNASAFEGWAICIKSLLGDKIAKVEIKWDKPNYIINKKKSEQSQKCHYNRFIYRAIRFRDNYDWVELDGPKDDIDRISKELNNKKWVINYPSKKSKENAAYGEAKLERIIDEVLKDKWEESNADHQLPVGLYYKNVENIDKYKRTPSGLSDVDLWAIDKKNGIMYIYELKDNANESIGIISELMFYVNVINDLKQGIINYPKNITLDRRKIRNIETVIEAIDSHSIKNIIGVFLANNLHPLITNNKKNVIKLLNTNRAGIKFCRNKLIISIEEDDES